MVIVKVYTGQPHRPIGNEASWREEAKRISGLPVAELLSTEDSPYWVFYLCREEDEFDDRDYNFEINDNEMDEWDWRR